MYDAVKDLDRDISSEGVTESEGEPLRERVKLFDAETSSESESDSVPVVVKLRESVTSSESVSDSVLDSVSDWERLSVCV